MKVLKRISIIIGFLALIALGLWWFGRRPIPVEFIGSEMPGRFYFNGQLNKEPLVNLPWLGGGRLVWPYHVAGGDGSPEPADTFCGYVKWDEVDPSQMPTIKAGGIEYAANDVTIDHRDYSGPGVIVTPTSSALVIPYATDALSRDVEIRRGGQTWKARLPVNTKWGTSDRRRTEIKAGPHVITVQPERWALSTAPFIMKVSGEVPANRVLVVVPTDTPPKSGMEISGRQGWLIEHDMSTTIDFWRSRKLQGFVLELEVVQLTLRAVDGGVDARGTPEGFNLVDGDGKVVLQRRRNRIHSGGWVAMECKGDWFGPFGNFVTSRPPLVDRGYRNIKVGEVVTAIGYRSKGTWPFETEVDAPPLTKSPMRLADPAPR